MLRLLRAPSRIALPVKVRHKALKRYFRTCKVGVYFSQLQRIVFRMRHSSSILAKSNHSKWVLQLAEKGVRRSCILHVVNTRN